VTTVHHFVHECADRIELGGLWGDRDGTIQQVERLLDAEVPAEILAEAVDVIVARYTADLRYMFGDLLLARAIDSGRAFATTALELPYSKRMVDVPVVEIELARLARSPNVSVRGVESGSI